MILEGFVCRNCGIFFNSLKETKALQKPSWIALAVFTAILVGVLIFGQYFFHDIIGVIIIWIFITIWGFTLIGNIYA